MPGTTFTLDERSSGDFKNILVQSSGDKKLTLTIKHCLAPFGITDNNNKSEIVLSLGDKQSAMISLLTQFDTDAIKNIKSLWFTEDEDFEYRPTLFQSNKKYPPNMRIRLNENTLIYDENKFVKNENDIHHGSYVDVVFECGGIWIMNDRSGVTWRAKEIKIKDHKKQDTSRSLSRSAPTYQNDKNKEPSNMTQYAFNEEDE